MGFFNALGMTDIVDQFTGQAGADAARESSQAQIQAAQMAIDEQRRAGEQGLGFLDPFSQVGQLGLDQMGFSTDSQAQFDWLQNNPLFQFALDNANQSTMAQGAAGGRMAAGDTRERLSNNVFLSAQPLIDRQIGRINNNLNMGLGTAQSQSNTAMGVGSNVSNLMTDQGAARAGGIMGAANARTGAANNLMQMGAMAFSDSRLKENAEIVGNKNGFNVWSWTWNKLAKDKLGLTGESVGVMFSEVLEKMPAATSYEKGFGKVNYLMVGA